MDAIEKILGAWDAYNNDMKPERRNDFLREFAKQSQSLREHKTKQAEGVTEALKFFEKLYDKEVRGLENHSHFDPTYEQRQSYVVSFYKYITTIRQALTQGDGG